MAMLMKSSTMKAGVRPAKSGARPSVAARAAADRPLWFPGNPAPAHLDGS
jgi:hypothetical protein